MPLTKQQLDHLEHRLREERGRIEHELNRAADEHAGDDRQERAGDLTKVPLHTAVLGTDTIDEELAASEVIPWARTCDQVNE